MRIDNSLHPCSEADIVFIGIPETNSSTPNPLNSKAPDLLRFALNNKDDYDVSSKHNCFDDLKICDYGNVKKIKSFMKEYKNQKLFIMGGEHTITKDAVKFLKNRVKDLNLIVFDAHLDVRESGESNSRFLRSLIDSGVKTHLVGQRVYSKEEAEFIKKNKINILDKINLRGKNIYISFDIDVVDDVYVPSCSTPEPFGKSLEYYTKMLSKLVENNNLIGIDFVEFSGKEYDITYSNIAGVIMSLLKKFLKK